MSFVSYFAVIFKNINYVVRNVLSARRMFIYITLSAICTLTPYHFCSFLKAKASKGMHQVLQWNSLYHPDVCVVSPTTQTSRWYRLVMKDHRTRAENTSTGCTSILRGFCKMLWYCSIFSSFWINPINCESKKK